MEDNYEKFLGLLFIASPVLSGFALLGGCLGLGLGEFLVLSGVGTATVTSFAYHGFNKLIRHMNFKEAKENIFLNQTLLMTLEQYDRKDKIINSTTNFIDFIKARMNCGMNKIDKEYSNEVLNDLNQLLYLINCNYYHQIGDAKGWSREELLGRVVDRALKHLNGKSDKNLVLDDFKEIINSCHFIDPMLQKDIFSEFKKGKIKMDDKVNYAVIPNYYSSNHSFDVDNDSDYNIAIEMCISRMSYMLQDKAMDLEWDIDFLKEMMQTINRDYRPVSFNLVSSFINNAITYSLVNKKEKVGSLEMMKVFKISSLVADEEKEKVIEDISTNIRQKDFSKVKTIGGIKN